MPSVPPQQAHWQAKTAPHIPHSEPQLVTPSQVWTQHSPAASQKESAPPHGVPGTARASGGHAALPEQLSATSHGPVDGRQTIPVEKPSAGHAALDPVHVSATSQPPIDARHSNDAARNRSVGHDALDPVQVSATSQAPIDERHTKDDDW